MKNSTSQQQQQQQSSVDSDEFACTEQQQRLDIAAVVAVDDDEHHVNTTTDPNIITTTATTTTTTSSSNTNNDAFHEGRWTPEEKLIFLKGLRQHGKGKWKMIASHLPTRSILQVKSHGQKILAKLEAGMDVFEPLDQAEASGVMPDSPHGRQHASLCRLCHGPTFPLDIDQNHKTNSKQNNAYEPITLLQHGERLPSTTIGTPFAQDIMNDGLGRPTENCHDTIQDSSCDSTTAAIQATETPTEQSSAQQQHLESPQRRHQHNRDWIFGHDDEETDVALVLCQLSSSTVPEQRLPS